MAPSDDLRNLEARMRDLLARLRRPDPEFTFATAPRHDGGPHVEPVDGGLFDWVHTERGVELSRQRVSGGELLFVAMEALTAELAQQAEMRARGGAAYSRLRWMEAQIRLMRHLDPDWGDRVEARHRKTLTDQPLRAEEALAGLAPLDLSAFGVD